MISIANALRIHSAAIEKFGVAKRVTDVIRSRLSSFIRLLFLFLSLNLCSSSSAQEAELYLSKLPLTNGYIYKSSKTFNFGIGTRSDGVFIHSKNNSCYATTEGVVVSVLDLGGEYAVVTKTRFNTFITYSHLDSAFVLKNSTITKGALLGLAKMENFDYELGYIVCTDKSIFLSYGEHINYLKQVNQ